MSGGHRRGAGRKPVQIDLVELEKLCALQCTDEEIAHFMGVVTRTIESRRKQPEFAEVMKRGRAKGRMFRHMPKRPAKAWQYEQGTTLL